MSRIIIRKIFPLTVLTMMMGCTNVEIQSNWANGQPMIDGHLDEWTSASFVVFDDLHVSVSIGNDSSFLYLGGRIANRPLQHAVEQSGITIWLDSEGGKQKTMEIHFPAPKVADANLNRGGFVESMTEEEKIKLRHHAEEASKGVLVIDKTMVESRIYKPGNVKGFEGTILSSQGLTCFEARIPLNFADEFPQFGPVVPGTRLNIGLELGGSIDMVQNGGGEAGLPLGGLGRPDRGAPQGGLWHRGSRTPNGKEVWLEVSLARPH